MPKDKIEGLKKLDTHTDEGLIEIYNDAFRSSLTIEHLNGGVRKAVIRDLNKYYDVVNQKEQG